MEKTVLKSGLTVVGERTEGTSAHTCMVLVGAGSRYEEKHENGMAHFLEHLFFKGGEKYPKPKQVAETVDAIGADFNAFTGKEYAGYYIKADSRHENTVMDVLSDMLVSATLPEDEIERERGVILEEYNMYQDMPMYQVGWQFEELLFGDKPLGWDQLGPPENIRTLTKEQFKNFRKELYTPENTVVAVTGNICFEESVKKIEELFCLPQEKKARSWQPMDAYAAQRIRVQNRNTEQGHLVVGVPAVEAGSPEADTAKVLSTILGGGMSSRLFLSVREQRGLCYAIHTSTDTYADCGALSTYAGVKKESAKEAIAAICDEYKRIAHEPVSEKELNRAKEYIKGKGTLSLEDSQERAHFFAREELLSEKPRSPKEAMDAIDAVTKEGVAELAKKLFSPENMRLSIIGPYKGEEEALENALK